jgi:hypothetical protein
LATIASHVELASTSAQLEQSPKVKNIQSTLICARNAAHALTFAPAVQYLCLDLTTYSEMVKGDADGTALYCRTRPLLSPRTKGTNGNSEHVCIFFAFACSISARQAFSRCITTQNFNIVTSK